MFLILSTENRFHKLVTKLCEKILNKKNCIILTKNYQSNLNKNFKKYENIILINYYSPFIVPETLLKKSIYSINIHPGSSKFPGRGCYSWAIYKGEKKYGVVAHFMKRKVDTGPIIKEIKFKIEKKETIESLKFKTFIFSIELLLDLIIKLKNNKISASSIKWKRKAYKIKDLSLINMIKYNDSKKKAERIYRSTAYYPYGPYFQSKDKKVIKIKIPFKKNII